MEFNPPLTGSNGVNDDVPHVTQLFAIIYAIQFWLAWHPEHRVLVHCRDGVQQTGYVIATYLAYTGEMDVSDTMDALQYFKRFRVKSDNFLLTRAARFILLNVNGLLHLPPAAPVVHYLSHLFVQLPGPIAEQDYHAPIVHIYQGRHRVFDRTDIRTGMLRSAQSMGSPPPRGAGGGQQGGGLTSPLVRRRTASTHTAGSHDGDARAFEGGFEDSEGEFAPTPLGAHRMLWTNGSLKVPVHRLLSRDIQVRVYSYAVARAEEGCADAEDAMNAEFDLYHQQRADLARLALDGRGGDTGAEQGGALDEMTEACDFTAFLERKQTAGLRRRLLARFAFHSSMLPPQALGMKGDNIDVVCKQLVDAADVQFDLVLMTPDEAGLTGRRPRHQHQHARPSARVGGGTSDGAEMAGVRAGAGGDPAAAASRLPEHVLDNLNAELHRVRHVEHTHPESLLNLRGASAQLAGMTVLSNAHVCLVDSELFQRLQAEGWDHTALTVALQCTNNNLHAARTVLSGGLMFNLGAHSWSEGSLAQEAGRVRSRGGALRGRGGLLSGKTPLSTHTLQGGIWAPAHASGMGAGSAQLAVRASPLRRTRQQLARDEAPVSPGGRTLLPPGSPLVASTVVQDTPLVDVQLEGVQGGSGTLSLTREELYAVRTVLMQRGTGVVHTTASEEGQQVPLFTGVRGSAFSDAGVITGNTEAAGLRLHWGGASPQRGGHVRCFSDAQQSLDVSSLVAAVASGLAPQSEGGAGGGSSAPTSGGLRDMASSLAGVAAAGARGREKWDSQGAAIQEFIDATAAQLGEGGGGTGHSRGGSLLTKGAFHAASASAAGADPASSALVLSEAAEHIRAAVRESNMPEAAQTRLIQALSILEHAEVVQQEQTTTVTPSIKLAGLGGRRSSFRSLVGTAKPVPAPASHRASPALRPAASPLNPLGSAYTLGTPASGGSSSVDTLFQTPGAGTTNTTGMPYGAPGTRGSAPFRSPPIGPFDAISIASASASAAAKHEGGAGGLDSDSTGSPPSGARSPARSRGATLELLADLGRGAGGSSLSEMGGEGGGSGVSPPPPRHRGAPPAGPSVDLLAPYDARAVIIARLKEKVSAALSPAAVAAATAAAEAALAGRKAQGQLAPPAAAPVPAPGATPQPEPPAGAAGAVQRDTGEAAPEASEAHGTPTPAVVRSARDTPQRADSPPPSQSTQHVQGGDGSEQGGAPAPGPAPGPEAAAGQLSNGSKRGRRRAGVAGAGGGGGARPRRRRLGGGWWRGGGGGQGGAQNRRPMRHLARHRLVRTRRRGPQNSKRGPWEAGTAP